MANVKFKTKSSLKKRFFKLTAKGKVKIKHAHTSHLAYNKTTKQNKRLHKSSLLDKTDFKRLRKLLQR
jgi:large subunit ribosomal protein L35